MRAKIRDGHWPAGTLIPGRKQLAREQGVALNTVQKAVASLLADGILRAEANRGTFVARGTETADNEAASRSGKQTPLFGMIAAAETAGKNPSEIRGFWIRPIVRSLEQAFVRAGGSTRFSNLHPSPGQAPISVRDSVQSLLAQSVDAIAVVGIYERNGLIEEVFDAVQHHNDVPVAVITWDAIDVPLPHVFYDNEAAGFQAAWHLLQSGYERLLFLEPFPAKWLEERIEGARKAVRQAGLPLGALQTYTPPSALPEWKHERENQAAGGYQSALAAIQEGALWGGTRSYLGVCGIIAPNDAVAFGVLRAASEAGKAAGPDFGLIGFDDFPESCQAGLTSLRPPLEEMGHEAARLLVCALRGERQNLQVRLRSHLLPRASTFLAPPSLTVK